MIHTYSQLSSRTGGNGSLQNPSALSASYLKNGGGQGHPDWEGEKFAMFAPAEPTERRKKRRNQQQQPQPLPGPENRRPESRTPPPTLRPPQSPERGRVVTELLLDNDDDDDDDDDLWYAKWWMFCFPEMNLHNVSPKR